MYFLKKNLVINKISIKKDIYNILIYWSDFIWTKSKYAVTRVKNAWLLCNLCKESAKIKTDNNSCQL